MVAKVINMDGNVSSEIELQDEIFGIKYNNQVIYDAIKNELANKRLGTVKTKNISEVSGSNSKPYRQKGTGRARAGHKRSPVWVGGAVSFGPTPRDHSYKLPKKMKRLALKSILSMKLQKEQLKFVDDIVLDKPKTKVAKEKFVKVSNLNGKTSELKNGKLEKEIKKYKLVYINDDNKTELLLASRNLHWVKCINYKRLNALDLFYANEILISKKALEGLKNFWSL